MGSGSSWHGPQHNLPRTICNNHQLSVDPVIVFTTALGKNGSIYLPILTCTVVVVGRCQHLPTSTVVVNMSIPGIVKHFCDNVVLV